VWFRDGSRGSLAGVRVLRSSSGQGSIEYVGLIAVVALLIVISGAALAQASDVSRRVTRQFARALCVVRGGDCARDRQPCVMTSRTDEQGWRAKALVIEISRGRVALMERRSDGSVAVTWTKERATGAARDFGIGAEWRALGVDLEVGGEVRVGARTAEGDGRTWILPSEAAGRALLAQLERDEDDAPPADIVSGGRVEEDAYGAFVTASGSAKGVGLNVAEAGGGLAMVRTTGARLDRRTGRRTFYARTRKELSGRAGLAGGVLGAGVGSTSEGELFAVEVDERGRPVDLAVVATGRYASSADLPGVLSPVVGRLPGGARSRRWEVTTHLDLTDPRNLAAARDVLVPLRTGMVPFGAMLESQRALRARLAAAGTVEARIVDHSSADRGRSVEGRLLVEGGGEKIDRSEDAQTVAAVSRGLDRQWITREDCAATA
jgi:hypothetical protein